VLLIRAFVVRPDAMDVGWADLREAIMSGARTARAGALLALLTGALLLLALIPGTALAAWKDVQASVVDPRGTGVVPFLNVEVANHAVDDSSAVTTVQFSDDGRCWYAVPYTGKPCVWVLGGTSGRKDFRVRFGAADGSVSPVITASIDVDTTGPVTVARRARPASGGRMALRFTVSDAGSRSVQASVSVKGTGGSRQFALGRVHTGAGTALVKLPKGTYTWKVLATDLAGRAQVRQTAATLVVR